MTYKRLIKRIEFFVRLWTSGQVPGTLNQSYKRQWDIAVWQLPGVNAHWQDCRATATTVVQSSNPLYDVSRVIRVVQTLGTLVIHFLNLGSSGWFIRGYLGYTPRHTDSFHRSSRLFRRAITGLAMSVISRLDTPWRNRGALMSTVEEARLFGNLSTGGESYCFESSLLTKIFFLLFYVKIVVGTKNWIIRKEELN